jgi:hypothetical protein
MSDRAIRVSLVLASYMKETLALWVSRFIFLNEVGSEKASIFWSWTGCDTTLDHRSEQLCHDESRPSYSDWPTEPTEGFQEWAMPEFGGWCYRF